MTMRRRNPARVRAWGVPRLVSTVGGMALAAILLASCASGSKAPTAQASGSSHPIVGFMIPDSTTPRWTAQDAPDFISAMHKLDPSARVVVENADNSPATQLAQAQALISEGAKAIVLVAVDEVQAGTIVRAAHSAGIPVIAYTRMPSDSPVSYMVGSSPYLIGVDLGKYIMAHTKQGDTIAVLNGSFTDSFAHAEHNGFMSVLQPAFTSGSRHEVGNVWTPNWLPSDAQAEMAAILTQTHNNVQAVLSPNDGLATGVIAALSTQGLAGKIPVTGIDGGLNGDRLILKGLLSMTVWRNSKVEAYNAAQIVQYVLDGKKPPKTFFDSSVYNGLVHVPLKTHGATVITAKNMYLEIQAGVFTKGQLCAGIPAGTGPC